MLKYRTVVAAKDLDMEKFAHLLDDDEECRPVDMEGVKDDTYYVTNKGRLISTARRDEGKFLSTNYTNQHGYVKVSLHFDEGRKIKYLHRVVLETFKDPPNDDREYETHHIDGDRSNNHIDNLEWVTHQENLERANHARGEDFKDSKLTDEKVKDMRRLYDEVEWATVDKISTWFGMSYIHTYRIIKGDHWEHVDGEGEE